MEVIPSQINDLEVVRRALFVSVYLPKACPNYWSVVTQFATMNSQLGKDLDSTTVKTMIENLQLLNATAFSTDKQLMEEIHALYFLYTEAIQYSLAHVFTHLKIVFQGIAAEGFCY